MEAVVWAVSAALSRELPAGVVFEGICPLSAGMVRAEASRRRFCGNFCGVDDAARGMAKEVSGLGRDDETPLHGEDREGNGQRRPVAQSLLAAPYRRRHGNDCRLGL